MALISDPDSLNDSSTDNGSTEVYINTSSKTIKLNTTGNLSTDGVTLKALYSFLKEEWRNDPNNKNLAAFPFPMVPITDESFELVDGWDFLDDTARYLIRTGGWTVRNVSGNVTQKWAGIIGLGSIESNDQLYYQQVVGNLGSNVQLTGQINQVPPLKGSLKRGQVCEARVEVIVDDHYFVPVKFNAEFIEPVSVVAESLTQPKKVAETAKVTVKAQAYPTLRSQYQAKK